MVVADVSTVVWPVVFIVVAFGPAAVNFAKGKFWWGLFSFLGVLWPFTVVPAIRLARPESWWARNLYDEKATARSRERFAE